MYYVLEANGIRTVYNTKADAMKTVKKLIKDETVFYLFKILADGRVECVKYSVWDGFNYMVC